MISPGFVGIQGANFGGAVLWTPSQITTLGWWDPSQTGTITESGGLVSKIDDLGTSGIEDMVQGTGSSQPTTGTRTLGGLNLLDCDGGDVLERLTFPIPSSGDVAVFMIGEVDTVDSTSDSVFSMDAATADYQFDANSVSQFDGRILSAGLGPAAILLTGGPFAGPSIYNANFDFSDLGIINAFIDGNQRAVNTAYSTKLNASQKFRLFANRGGTVSPVGAFGEVVACEACDTTTRQLIEGYLAWKWDGGVSGVLVGNLPGGHPYKTAAPTV